MSQRILRRRNPPACRSPGAGRWKETSPGAPPGEAPFPDQPLSELTFDYEFFTTPAS
ncbi:MAG: hypothetical protein JW913_05115 [Chitinispirillaceae bacterium]|nr:hypothetical protein [Chitinispirillaceae bacterium]